MPTCTRRAWLGASTLALLAGCAALAPTPHRLELSQARLQALMDAKFPQTRRYLTVLDLTLEHPRIGLLPVQNRLSTRFDYAVALGLPGAPLHRGSMSLSFALRYEPRDHTLRLTQTRLDALEAEGSGPPHEVQLRRVADQVVEQQLRDLPIHTFKRQDIEAAQGRGVQPGVITVLPDAVRLSLEPVVPGKKAL